MARRREEQAQQERLSWTNEKQMSSVEEEVQKCQNKSWEIQFLREPTA